MTVPDILGGGASLLVRMAATAGFVLLMGWLVATARPAVAAAAIGLPVVVGPGFFVLALERPDAFVVASAWSGLAALAGTAAFAAGTGALADRPAALALAGGLGAWAGAVAAALTVAAAAPGGAGAAAAFAAAWLALAPRRRLARAARPGGWRPAREALRAGAAGLTVGAVTLAAGRLGPQLSGALLAIPVGMIFLAQGLLTRGDPATARAVLLDGVRGALALAAFMATTALTAGVAGALPAVLGATAVSCATAAMIGRAGAPAAKGG
jgi:hypothetical protein